MDVEKIQKINDLAMNLMRQGLAEDKESALEQAERIYQGQSNEIYDNVKDVGRKAPEPPVTNAPRPGDLSSSQIKQILKQNTEFVVKKFKEFQTAITKLEREIEDLKINAHKQPSIKQLVANQVPAVEPKQAKQPAQAPPQAEQGKKNPHPRVGRYNEDDVSIEKFFYMGTK